MDNKIRFSLAALTALTASGCGFDTGLQTPSANVVIPIPATYYPSDDDWARIPGSGVIKGSAFLRTVGGEVRTCAAQDVFLFPASTYSLAFIRTLFKSENGGYKPAYDTTQYESIDRRILGRNTVCDANGNFSFSGLAAGDYIVVAEVSWTIPNRYLPSKEGGALARRVSVTSAQPAEVLMTAN